VRFAAVLVLLACALGACGGDDEAAAPAGSTAGGGERPVRVVTTTTQLTDFAREIGGDRVTVYGVVRPNVDPHDYEPSPADLEEIRQADVVVRNGVDLEHWFDDVVDSSGTHAAIVDASHGIAIRTGGAGGDGNPDGGGDGNADGAGDRHDDGEGDPHIWTDPRNAEQMVRSIAAALTTADPAGAATYQSALDSYIAELSALDASIAQQIGTLTNKKLVTNHDAFGYYVARYGLDYVGSVIPSFDSTAELSAGELQDLVDRIRAEGVKAVFSESSLPAKTAETIAREAGVRVVDGEDALYGDALGPPGSPADTYLHMMEHNTAVIVENLR
jgi:ABC-type Zn uptake system ZnuABC Zn-binding protein ZnuA